MTSLPAHYASPIHLPFNRACLDGQLVLQGPGADPGGSGYGVLLRGNKMYAAKAQGRFVLPHGEWADESSLYLGRWQDQPCYLIDLDNAAELPENLESFVETLSQNFPKVDRLTLSLKERRTHEYH